MLGLQHVVTLDIRLQHIAVAPPRGVRGLKYVIGKKKEGTDNVAPPRGVRGLKCFQRQTSKSNRVAPPRGVRGLKSKVINLSDCISRRTPSWGAWIEIMKLK